MYSLKILLLEPDQCWTSGFGLQNEIFPWHDTEERGLTYLDNLLVRNFYLCVTFPGKKLLQYRIFRLYWSFWDKILLGKDGRCKADSSCLVENSFKLRLMKLFIRFDRVCPNITRFSDVPIICFNLINLFT